MPRSDKTEEMLCEVLMFIAPDEEPMEIFVTCNDNMHNYRLFERFLERVKVCFPLEAITTNSRCVCVGNTRVFFGTADPFPGWHGVKPTLEFVDQAVSYEYDFVTCPYLSAYEGL